MSLAAAWRAAHLSWLALSQDLPLTTVGPDSWVLRCHEILEDALRDTLARVSELMQVSSENS